MDITTCHSSYLDSSDQKVIDFYKAVDVVEKATDHPLSKIISATPVLQIITNNTVDADFWKSKYDGLCAVILTNELVPFDGELVPPDRLGYFFTAKSESDFVKIMARFHLSEESVKGITSSAKSIERNSHEYHSVIVILKNAVEAFSESNGLDYATVIRIVLWHELGHLVFNPNCSVQRLHDHIVKPTGKYKRSKALQFLIEGSAEWFAYHAEEWDEKHKSHLFNLDDSNSDDEYSYLSTLLHFHPVMLQRVLLPLVFNCWQTALCNIPVDDGENPILKIKPDDFSASDQGMDFETIDGFVSRVARPLNVKLGFSEILLLLNIFPEFFDQETIDDSLFSSLSLPPANDRESNESIKINIPLFGEEREESSWTFDSYMVPQEGKVNNESLVVGFSFNPLQTTVFAMNKTAKRGENPWYIFYSVGPQGKGNVNVWCRSSAWAEKVARRAAYKTCLSE